MKIESAYQKYQVPNSVTTGITPKNESPKKAISKSVDFSFSETTKNLQKSSKSLENSTIHSEKIAAIKASIQQGTYKVDADELAKSMMNSDK